MVFMVFRMVWSAQVAQLQDGVRVLAGRQQDVLRFEVPMADLLGVEVGDGRGSKHLNRVRIRTILNRKFETNGLKVKLKCKFSDY